MTVLALSWLEDQSPRDLVRWAAAAAIVFGIHGGAIGYFLSQSIPDGIGDDSDVVTVELAPIDSTPDAVARDVAPAPETMIESKPVAAPQVQQKTEETKVEAPPDQSLAIVPEPVIKPPEMAEEARPPAPHTAEQVKGGAPRIEPSWQTLSLIHISMAGGLALDHIQGVAERTEQLGQSYLRQLQRVGRAQSEFRRRTKRPAGQVGIDLSRRSHT